MLRTSLRSRAALLAVTVLIQMLFAVPARAAATHGWTTAWGSNSSGQLGAAGGDRSSPTDVGLPEGLPGVRAVAAGDGHSLALSIRGEVFAWGENTFGQLGRGTFGPGSNSAAPAKVATLPTIVAISAGGQHSLAVSSDGDVYAWGNNVDAQLGLDPRTVGLSAVPVRVGGLPANDPVREVAGGRSHSVARTAGGVLYAWGSNVLGQLGTGPLLVLQPAPAVVTTVANVRSVSAGANHTIAVVGPERSVYAWGDNSRGQLNDPDTAGRFNPVPVAVGIADATAVAGGAAHSVALGSDGSVRTWGDNRSGQLGRSGSGAPAVVPDLAGVRSIAAGADHTVVVARNADQQHVLTWGSNSSGQLGNGSSGATSPTPVRAGSLATTIVVDGGGAHTLAVSAPKASLDLTELRFPGVVEVGRTTAPRTITLENEGPGPLVVSSAQLSAEQDFRFAPEGDGCSGRTLPADGTCAMAIVFSPADAGLRTATLEVRQDGFDGTLYATISGMASVVAGQIAVTTDPQNLIDGVPASPPRVPLSDIPLQPRSPAMADVEASGELPLGDVTGIGELPLGDVTGIGELPLGDVTGIGELPLGDVTGIGELPLGDVTGIGPLAETVLRSVSLSSLSLRAPYSWDGDADASPTPVLAGTPLAGLPLQQVSFGDVIADPIAGPRLAAIPISVPSWSSSKLGGIGLLAVLLGKTQLEQIVIPPATTAAETWCAVLDESLGTSDCARDYARDPATDANGLTATALEMQLAGVPFGALPLAKIRLGDVTPAPDAPYRTLPLSLVDLYRSDLGGIEVSAIAPDRDAVVDCSKVDCATASLHEAAVAGALRSGATIGGLGAAIDGFTLAQLGVGLVHFDEDVYGAILLDRLGILPYAGPGASSVRYDVSFTNDPANPLPDESTIQVTLPSPQFIYVPGSTRLTIDGEPGTVTGPTLEDGVLTWGIASSVPAAADVMLSFEARPGFTLGTFTIPSASVGGVGERVAIEAPSAPVRVVESLEGRGIPFNDEPADATSIAPSRPGAPGELVISHISGADDRDLFTFDAATVPAGSLITAYLDHLEADADLAMFYPAGASSEAPLRAPSPSAPLVPVPDELPRLEGRSSSLQGNVQNDIDLVTGLPLAALSQNRGDTSEIVRAVAVPANEGDVYTLEVVGYNREFSDAPYSIRVVVSHPPTLPPCQPRTFPHPADGSLLGAMPTRASLDGADTVFVVARGRIQRMYGTDGLASVDAALDAVVADTELRNVAGEAAVLPVDARVGHGTTDVQAAYDAWDADPCDPELANDVVRGITALIDELVPATVQNVVLVGGDDIVPQGRVADRTVRVNERDFLESIARATSANNALVGATALGRFMTDDAYGLPITVTRPGGHLYIPTVPVGRLVEDPTQIVGMLNDYRVSRATADPQSALTTAAADFLEDLGGEVHDVLGATLGSPQSKLIEGDWGKDEMRTAFTQAADTPDIVSMNGHSDPWSTMPKIAATRDDLFTTADIHDAASLARLLLFSVGCHTGTLVADGVAADGEGSEWAQALAARGAIGFAGQTGYGIGSRSTIALTEQVALDFARNLGRMTLGQALAEAKRTYFATAGSLDVFDEKALMQATYYGVPSMRFTGVAPQPYTPPALQTGTDGATGLPTASVATQSSDPSAPGYFELRSNTTPEGTYWSANGGVTADEGRPLQPSFSVDVTRAGMRAHGALITGLTSSDQVDVDPVIAYPVAAGAPDREREPQIGSIAYPTGLQSIRHTRANGGGRDDLVITPGSFISTGVSGGVTKGRQRLFSSVAASVLYADADVTDFVGPTIVSVDGVIVDSVATFSVRAFDPTPGDSVRIVNVVYHELGSGAWRTLTLQRSLSDPERWTGGVRVPGERVEFFVQAADSNGNTSLAGNKGRLYEAVPPPERGDLIVTISGTEAANGWFEDATVSLEAADDGVAIEVRVDDERGRLYTGPVTFVGDGVTDVPGAIIGDGYRTLRYKASNGASGVVTLPIDRSPPRVNVTSPPRDGSGSYGVGESLRASFSCADSASGIPTVDGCVATVDGAPVADGGSLPTTPGVHSLVVTGRDIAGHVRTVTVPYRVSYEFEGFLAPIKNRPQTNSFNAGQTIAVKWRLRNADGTEETSVSTVRSTGSFQINCALPPPISTVPGEPTSSGSELTYTGGHFRYNWKTQGGLPPAGWQGTCRRFVLVLSDDTARVADFEFS